MRGDSPWSKASVWEVFFKCKSDHATLLLQALQWLPNAIRIKSIHLTKTYISFHSPSFTLLQSLGLSFCSSVLPGLLLPQDLCISWFLCLECSCSDLHMAACHQWSQFQGHLRDAFLDLLSVSRVVPLTLRFHCSLFIINLPLLPH